MISASWSGFQAVNQSGVGGYLTIFRERLNQDQSKEIVLKFLNPVTKIIVTDLMLGTEGIVEAGKEDMVKFTIETPDDFRFSKYDLVK